MKEKTFPPSTDNNIEIILLKCAIDAEGTLLVASKALPPPWILRQLTFDGVSSAANACTITPYIGSPTIAAPASDPAARPVFSQKGNTLAYIPDLRPVFLHPNLTVRDQDKGVLLYCTNTNAAAQTVMVSAIVELLPSAA